MSDIQPGDVVVCVDDSVGKFTGRQLLRRGAAYRVTGVGLSTRGTIILDLAGMESPDYGFFAGRFRKIRPCEEEFTILIRKMKERTNA